MTTTLSDCPSWCDAEPGHDPEDMSWGRVHRHDLGRVGSVLVELARWDRSDLGPGAEEIEVNGEPLSAVQGRELAAVLLRAADELESARQ